jgi:hypothetical protein
MNGKPRLPPRLQNAKDTIPEDGKQPNERAAPRAVRSSEKRQPKKDVPRPVTGITDNGRTDSTPRPPLSNRNTLNPGGRSYSYYDPNSPLHPNDFENTAPLSRRVSAPVGNEISPYPAGSQMPRGIDPAKWPGTIYIANCTTPMNPQPSSHPSSQLYFSDFQEPRIGWDMEEPARGSIPSANGWGGRGEQTPQRWYNSVVPPPPPEEHTPLPYYNNLMAQRATSENTTGYGGPPAGPQWDTPYDRRHTAPEIPRMQQEPFERHQYVNNPTFASAIPEPSSIPACMRSYPSRVATSRRTSDLQNGMSRLSVSENEDNANYMAGNETWTDRNDESGDAEEGTFACANEIWTDGQSLASRTTNNSESTSSINITYSSAVSDDDGRSSRRTSYDPADGMNNPVFSEGNGLQRSQQRYEDQDRSDVRLESFPLQSQTQTLICEAGKYFQTRGRRLGK